ncbi:hypothetical protein BDP27DRAFT_1362769 [Rhodocollybia butyracea]|uniref:Uncharacterized protein n=1 Tax=Rhodocollybia butyracea TaxID=206335 RepID=A0A9P5U8S3_9AGAR|nr:hypothetical protein BDP27DRAFT_1362769 [Rhodocollybia butyracea]
MTFPNFGVQRNSACHRETGFHIGGYAWHPDAGASIFAGTKSLEKVKATNGTQMLTQAEDIGLQIVVTQLVEHKVGVEHCLFENEEGGVPKPMFSNFVERAWKYQVRVKNWPVGVPFLNIGVRLKKGYVTGVDMLNKYKAGDLNKICGPIFSK